LRYAFVIHHSEGNSFFFNLFLFVDITKHLTTFFIVFIYRFFIVFIYRFFIVFSFLSIFYRFFIVFIYRFFIVFSFLSIFYRFFYRIYLSIFYRFSIDFFILLLFFRLQTSAADAFLHFSSRLHLVERLLGAWLRRRLH
jgi:hypothetical protein